jgi:hypothetical protein
MGSATHCAVGSGIQHCQPTTGGEAFSPRSQEGGLWTMTRYLLAGWLLALIALALFLWRSKKSI